MDSFEILKSKQNIPEWKAGGLLSSTYKLPQGLSLIAAIRRDSAKKNMWKNVKYFKFSRHHRNKTFTGCNAGGLLSQIPLYPHSLRVWPALHRGEMVALEFLQIQLDRYYFFLVLHNFSHELFLRNFTKLISLTFLAFAYCEDGDNYFTNLVLHFFEI